MSLKIYFDWYYHKKKEEGKRNMNFSSFAVGKMENIIYKYNNIIMLNNRVVKNKWWFISNVSI